MPRSTPARENRHGGNLSPCGSVAEITEALAVGQEWDGGDVRVILFVRLASGASLDKELKKRLREAIRLGASPRHVPAKIISTPDIPCTRSGKITEIAVREIIHNRPVKNIGALANPESWNTLKILIFRISAVF